LTAWLTVCACCNRVRVSGQQSSTSNQKARRTALGTEGLCRHAIDPCCRRSPAQPIEHYGDCLPRTADHSGNGTVGFIAHPPRKTKPRCLFTSPGTKCDSLNPACHLNPQCRFDFVHARNLMPETRRDMARFPHRIIAEYV